MLWVIELETDLDQSHAIIIFNGLVNLPCFLFFYVFLFFIRRTPPRTSTIKWMAIFFQEQGTPWRNLPIFDSLPWLLNRRSTARYITIEICKKKWTFSGWDYQCSIIIYCNWICLLFMRNSTRLQIKADYLDDRKLNFSRRGKVFYSELM